MIKLVLPKTAKEKKRLKEWEAWVSQYETLLNNHITKVGKIFFIENAAYMLNDLYWKIANYYIRPQLKYNANKEQIIHPYKVISISEITVMTVLPLKVNGDEEFKKQENAAFAFFVANQLLKNWEKPKKFQISDTSIDFVLSFREEIKDNTKYPQSFAAEHLTWLAKLNVSIEKPVLINAQCWRLFHIACSILDHKLNQK